MEATRGVGTLKDICDVRLEWEEFAYFIAERGIFNNVVLVEMKFQISMIECLLI